MLRMVKRTSLVRRGNEADTLVKIAEKEIRFFFVNHLKQPCVVAKIRPQILGCSVIPSNLSSTTIYEQFNSCDETAIISG
jgi:hypothetical protein